MKVLFADTFYFIALFSSRDRLHARAQAASRQKMVRYVTSDWIITEVADAMSKGRARQRVAGLVSHLRSSPVWEIVPFSDTLFNNALAYHSRFRDKEWTLTDCTSFLIMQERGITEAMTGDHHFEQAGFMYASHVAPLVNGMVDAVALDKL